MGRRVRIGRRRCGDDGQRDQFEPRHAVGDVVRVRHRHPGKAAARQQEARLPVVMAARLRGRTIEAGIAQRHFAERDDAQRIADPYQRQAGTHQSVGDLDARQWQ